MNRLLRRGGIALSTLTLVSGASLGAAAHAAGASSRPGAGHRPAAGVAAAASTDTPAAQLYAALDELLREHVDLTATVVETAVTRGAGSADTKAAEAALGQNTDELGAAIGSLYGKAAEARFLQLWRAHIGFFVDYTLGTATHDRAEVATAERRLAGYVASFARFMSQATKLPVGAVEADLRGHVATLETAIGAIVAHSPAAGPDVQMAAAHMDGTARVLAEGIAASAHVKGDVTSPGSVLRAALTGLLVQHVADTGFVVETAVAAKGNLRAPEVRGAVAALAQNTDALGAAIGSVYGPGAKATFLKLWRAHVGFFVDYTLGTATHDAARVAQAQRDLAGYVGAFSRFLAGATKLPTAAVAADLRGHVATLETAIDALVAGKASAGEALLMAESHMAGTAAVLSQGIVASDPSHFAS